MAFIDIIKRKLELAEAEYEHVGKSDNFNQETLVRYISELRSIYSNEVTERDDVINNHSDLTLINTSINNFKSLNHTDETTLNTSVTNFKSANHSDLSAINSSIGQLKTSNHNDLSSLGTKLDSIIRLLTELQSDVITTNELLNSINTKTV